MSLSTTVAAQPFPGTGPSLPETTTAALPGTIPICIRTQISFYYRREILWQLKGDGGDSTKIKSSQSSTDAYPPVKVRTERTCSIISVLNHILSFLWILWVIFLCVMIVVEITIIVGLILASMALIIFAYMALKGVLAMLIGNSILRATHHAHYTSNAFAAYIGAVGCFISTLIVALLSQCMPRTRNKEGQNTIPWYIRMCLTLLLCTLSGTIGCAVLLHNHVDLGGIDVLHATRAGILGGVILGPGWSIGFPLALSLAVHLILLPLRIATLFGAKWLWVRSSESWTERGGYSYAVCVCAGGIQEDEIKESFVKVKSGLSLCM